MSDVLDLACELIRRRSVTPDDAGCQQLIAERLLRTGFRCEHLDHREVSNLWAVHGEGAPVLVFLGHTDVVPSGPEENWQSPPFEPTIRDGDHFCDRSDRENQKAGIHARTLKLYGRGAADMKSGVAAMTIALEEFVAAHPDHPGTIALLLTSDEEGPTNLYGVRRVIEHFRETGQRIDWCVVGEPSSRDRLGDLIRIGRRGSLSGLLTVRGVQGHVAYPQLARNPIHMVAPALAELSATRWDEGNGSFPPTSFQVSNIRAGTGALNVIPGELVVQFNFRFGTASSALSLRKRAEEILRKHDVDHAIEWTLGGDPFLTEEGELRRVAIEVCRELCGTEPELSTGGGTSDGRFIAPLGAEVMEIGPVNASIHKINEHIVLAELESLPSVYRAIAEKLLA